MLDGNFTVLIGRSLSIGCKCHIRVLQDVILEVHNRAFSTNKQNCILVIKHTNLIRGETVSYTHLDVYKRQDFCFAPRFVPPISCSQRDIMNSDFRITGFAPSPYSLFISIALIWLGEVAEILMI